MPSAVALISFDPLQCRWPVPERVTLIWRAWPDKAEEVVFNAASDQIHLLEEAVALFDELAR